MAKRFLAVWRPKCARFGAMSSTTTIWRRIWCFSKGELAKLVKSTVNGWVDDKAPRLGAALAFYTLLSLAPMVVVIIAIAGFAVGSEQATDRLMWQVRDLVGPQGAEAIQGLLKSAHTASGGVLATVLGVLTLILGATGVVNELRDALNTIWKVPSKKAQSSWRSAWSIVKERLFSFAMVVGIGFLLMVSLVVNAVLSAAGKFFSHLLPTPEWILQIVYTVFSFIVISILFAALYKFLPDITIEWRDVWVGAAVTSLLFSVGKLLIGLYLGKTSVANTYGAAGSLVIVLVWVYYSAQVFFLGAEFTCAYAHRHGSDFTNTLVLQPESKEAVVVTPNAEPKQLIIPG